METTTDTPTISRLFQVQIPGLPTIYFEAGCYEDASKMASDIAAGAPGGDTGGYRCFTFTAENFGPV